MIKHARYSVNAFAQACRGCGEEWPCRTVLLRALTTACDDGWTDGESAMASYISAAAEVDDSEASA